MKIFKTYDFQWWQIGLLKLSMVAFGLAVGATWPAAFAGSLTFLWIVFIVTAAYLTYVGLKQM